MEVLMKSQFLRLCGLAAVLGGALFLLIVGFGETNLENTAIWPFIPLLPVLLTLGVAGLFAFSGSNGAVRAMLIVIGLGTVSMTIGFALMVWLNIEEGWMLMVIGILIMTLGLLLFGLVNWRARVLPRWNWLPLIIGAVTTVLLLPGILGQPIGGMDSDFGFYLWLGTIGVGWVLLGLLLLLDGRTLSPAMTTIVALFALSLLLAACQGNSTEPRVRFSQPADNAAVSSPVRVIMSAENFTVEPAGDGTIHEGAGHLHIMVDTPCIAAGQTIPKDETHLHFGDGSTETELALAPGEHTLCLQAADGAHTALAGEGMTHTITVNVP
jgi:hypothetical protein